VRVMVRPEALALADDAGRGPAGRVADRRFAGASTFYRVELEGGGWATVQGGPRDAAPGDAVRLALRPHAGAIAYAPDDP
jgi:ABC-type Fe3+/spermidine/putrescine transport system ATPase subunit